MATLRPVKRKQQQDHDFSLHHSHRHTSLPSKAQQHQHQQQQITLTSSPSVEEHVRRLPKAHHHHDHHHHHHNKDCGTPSKIMVVVVCYFLGSFLIIMYSLTGLMVRNIEDNVAKLSYHSEWHPLARADRFPSVDDRIKFYMSRWYLPPCRDRDRDHNDRDGGKQKLFTHDMEIPSAVRTTATSANATTTTTTTTASYYKKLRVHWEGETLDFLGVLRWSDPMVLDKVLLQDCLRDHQRVLRDRFFFTGVLSTERYIQDRFQMRPLCIELMELFQSVTTTTSSSIPVLVTLSHAHRPVPMFAPWRRRFLDSTSNTLSSASASARLEPSSFDAAAYIGGNVSTATTSSIDSHQQSCQNYDRSFKDWSTSNTMATPIIWKFHAERQYNLMARASIRDHVPWHLKKQKAVWTSTFSGIDHMVRPKTEHECRITLPCRFILQHYTSNLVDAAYAPDQGSYRGSGRYNNKDNNNNDDTTPTTVSIVDGIPLISPTLMVPRAAQAYKILIHLDLLHQGGDDFGNGLAWKLYSSSVVLMYPPVRSTWLMEELLQPWVHYLPLQDNDETTTSSTTNHTSTNGSNAEEMVRWVMEHDEEAQRISERASLFIHDLLLHPDSAWEEDMIKSEMVKRYQAHWQSQ